MDEVDKSRDPRSYDLDVTFSLYNFKVQAVQDVIQFIYKLHTYI